MERCPTCRAAYRGEEICGRCQTDFRQILAVERAAAHHRRQALADLDGGHSLAADGHARTACRLHRCAESIQVAALTALACGEFDRALALAGAYWRTDRTLDHAPE